MSQVSFHDSKQIANVHDGIYTFKVHKDEADFWKQSFPKNIQDRIHSKHGIRDEIFGTRAGGSGYPDSKSDQSFHDYLNNRGSLMQRQNSKSAPRRNHELSPSQRQLLPECKSPQSHPAPEECLQSDCNGSSCAGPCYPPRNDVLKWPASNTSADNDQHCHKRLAQNRKPMQLNEDWLKHWRAIDISVENFSTISEAIKTRRRRVKRTMPKNRSVQVIVADSGISPTANINRSRSKVSYAPGNPSSPEKIDYGDFSGHGTHCAGQIGAKLEGNKGFVGLGGPNVQVVNVQIWRGFRNYFELFQTSGEIVVQWIENKFELPIVHCCMFCFQLFVQILMPKCIFARMGSALVLDWTRSNTKMTIGTYSRFTRTSGTMRGKATGSLQVGSVTQTEKMQAGHVFLLK